MRAPADASRSESGHRRSVFAEPRRGGARVSQVIRSSSSYVPWSNTPPAQSPPRPSHGGSRCCLRAKQNSRRRKRIDFEAEPHGPHVRVATLRRCRYRHRRKPRYWLGGLTLRQAGFAPARRLLKVSVGHRGPPSSLTHIAWSHYFVYRSQTFDRRPVSSTPMSMAPTRSKRAWHHPLRAPRCRSRVIQGLPILRATDSASSSQPAKSPNANKSYAESVVFAAAGRAHPASCEDGRPAVMSDENRRPTKRSMQ